MFKSRTLVFIALLSIVSSFGCLFQPNEIDSFPQKNQEQVQGRTIHDPDDGDGGPVVDNPNDRERNGNTCDVPADCGALKCCVAEDKLVNGRLTESDGTSGTLGVCRDVCERGSAAPIQLCNNSGRANCPEGKVICTGFNSMETGFCATFVPGIDPDVCLIEGKSSTCSVDRYCTADKHPLEDGVKFAGKCTANPVPGQYCQLDVRSSESAASFAEKMELFYKDQLLQTAICVTNVLSDSQTPEHSTNFGRIVVPCKFQNDCNYLNVGRDEDSPYLYTCMWNVKGLHNILLSKTSPVGICQLGLKEEVLKEQSSGAPLKDPLVKAIECGGSTSNVDTCLEIGLSCCNISWDNPYKHIPPKWVCADTSAFAGSCSYYNRMGGEDSNVSRNYGRCTPGAAGQKQCNTIADRYELRNMVCSALKNGASQPYGTLIETSTQEKTLQTLCHIP